MSSRQARVEALAKATKTYVEEEQKRINAEVKVLEAVLEGRAANVQKVGMKKVEEVAVSNLYAYLSGGRSG